MLIVYGEKFSAISILMSLPTLQTLFAYRPEFNLGGQYKKNGGKIQYVP